MWLNLKVIIQSTDKWNKGNKICRNTIYNENRDLEIYQTKNIQYLICLERKKHQQQ